MKEGKRILIEPVDNAYVIDDGEIKTAAWYCKNENKWRNIDMQLGKFIRCMVEKIQEEQLNDGEIGITITATKIQ